MRTALVLVHALPGLLALVAGAGALAPPRQPGGRPWWRRTYTLCVSVLLIGLAALLAHDWSALDTSARAVFAALAALGAVMAYRLWRAHAEQARRGEGWRDRYVDHVYFTYVSLWIGFLAAPALRLPLAQVTIPVMAAAVLGAGHLLLKRHRGRPGAERAPAAPPGRRPDGT